MPSDPHLVVEDAGPVWICTKCNRVWPVKGVPVCTICKAIAIECKYCEVWKPDYKCYNVEFVSDDDGELVADVEEICDNCLTSLCLEHNIEMKLELLDTVADDIANSDWGYDSSCKQTDEEDIL